MAGTVAVGFRIALVLALAGCLGGSKDVGIPPTSGIVPDLERVVAFDAQGTLDPTQLGILSLDVAYRLIRHDGGEPNIGITSAGNVFTSAGDAVVRSRDHGQTWEVVYDFGLVPGGGVDPRFNADPMLWVDPWTDRIFNVPMYPILACSDFVTSDDEGETWFDKPMSCGIPGVDHQKVTTAPPSAASPWILPSYPNIAYYCYTKILATNCAISLDGGLTFPYDTIVDDGAAGCGGINGHPSPAPDGTVYLAMPGCNTLHVGVTRNSGLTWEVHDTRFPIAPTNIDDEVAVATDGTVYVLYAGPDNLQYIGRSPDAGRTWLGPWKVSPPGVTSTFFEGLAAGDEGRIAYAFLGTRDGGGANPQYVSETARWHLYYGYSWTANATDPAFIVQQVTPDEDPVQVGCIWVDGFPSGPCRNMYDFIDLSIDVDGRPYIAYTEGCVLECMNNPRAKGDDSRASQGAVAILDHGPSLYDSIGLLPSLGLADDAGPLPR